MPLVISTFLLLFNQDCVSVRIANHESSSKSQTSIRFGYRPGRYKLRVCGNELLSSNLSIRCHDLGLVMHDIVGALISGEGLAVPRSHVLQQLDPWPRLRPKGRDSQMCP